MNNATKLKTTREQLEELAIGKVNQFIETMKNVNNHGDIFENLLPMVKNDEEINPYWSFLSLERLFKAIAAPSVQKELLKKMSEEQLEDSIEYLYRVTDGIRSMANEQHKAVFLAKEIEIYSGFDDSELQNIIDDYSLKTELATLRRQRA